MLNAEGSKLNAEGTKLSAESGKLKAQSYSSEGIYTLGAGQICVTNFNPWKSVKSVANTF